MVGAAVLSKVYAEGFEEEILKQWMEKPLTLAEDRALFGLEVKT